MVPLNMTYLHCLQHSLFEHLFNLYLTVYDNKRIMYKSQLVLKRVMLLNIPCCGVKGIMSSSNLKGLLNTLDDKSFDIALLKEHIQPVTPKQNFVLSKKTFILIAPVITT